MDSKYNINTDQNVSIELKIAGIGDRVIALIYDSLILIFFGFFIAIIVSIFDNLYSESGYIIWAIFGFVTFLFHFIQEWLFNGQTFGKGIRNIKVVKSNGVNAGFFQYLIRNLIRPIDSIYGLGLIFVFFSKKYQRLGDMAAGTIVIKLEKKVTSIQETIHKEIDNTYQPEFNRVDVLKINEQDIEIIKELTSKPNEQINWDLIRLMAEKLRKKTGLSNSQLNNKEFLETLVKDYYYHSLN